MTQVLMGRRAAVVRVGKWLGRGALALALGGACAKKGTPRRIRDAAAGKSVTMTGKVPSPATTATGAISKAIASAKAKAVGYKGAEGKVLVKNGNIVFIANADGNDVGVYVSFPAVNVGNNKLLTLDVNGKVFQKQGWDHYLSLQIKDEDGNRYIIHEFCREGKYGSCKGKGITALKSIRKGTTLKIKLPAGLKTIERIELVFVGQSNVTQGFTISNIGLSR
jgi:hypothetical protein